MTMQEAVEYLTKIAKKSSAEQFDVLAGSGDSQGISVFNGTLQNTEISNSCGIGIRVFKNKKPGYASTEKFSKKSLSQTLADAISNSEYTEPLEIDLPEPTQNKDVARSTATPEFITYNPGLENIDINHLLNTCLNIEKQILAASEIKNVPDLGATVSSSEMIFANSKGIFFKDKRNSFGIGAGAVAERNGVVKMGWYHKSGRDFDIVSVEQISGEVISRAKEFLSPMAISGGKTPVILSKRISAKIISIYLSSFHASKAQKGLSRLKGRLNEEIASEKFSLFSEPLLPALSGFKLMDDEGIPTAALNIVENGVFNSFLYNLESASKENRKSTGHGERSFSGKAGTSFINAVVPLSNLSNKEILSLFPKCLLINHLEGSSGCNPVSGEISIGVQGFWCENGIPVHAVDNLTVSTNFFDLLKNIVGIGSEYNDSFSNVKVPSLAISEMSVAS